ncbi:MAG: 4-alpha-glucanotransferase [Burkholderiales bacterium]|nr:4-alpha-glucanotransferase [Burkholderiales bacterium]OJX00852.1 MAG: 4-alpha-glucanotransferase [Burkholderiales bacterium 70-64]
MNEASSRQRLEWLAGAFGIEAAFHDIWGTRHEVPDASLRALLHDMGVAAASNEELARGLDQAHARHWRRLAEPVLALAAPAPGFALRLRLPRPGPRERLAWHLASETGEARSGEAELDTLELLECTEVDGEPYEARSLALEAPLAAGYHRLALRAGGIEAEVLIIAAPPRCWQPAAFEEGARLWGWSVQLYGLRSPRNWGVGDFGDLLALVDIAAAHGAAAVGLNPLHARFTHDPERASPYAPSSRLWLDPLSIDVESLDDLAEAEAVRARVRSAGFTARLQALRDSELVDFRGVSAAKHEVLRQLYDHFRRLHLAGATPRAAAFRAFQTEAGAALRRHALFEALQARFHAENPSIDGWPAWPAEFHDPDGAAVASYAVQALEHIEYYEYLQWLAWDQLARGAARCRGHGMAIGLYLDLAVAADRAGSDGWSFRACLAASASVGAPPDDFNLRGQDWGLPPPVPEVLRAHGHEPFALALRAGMREAGALRIDHVMELMRLFWVPPGGDARDGAYVRYPLDELLAVVTLESHRQRCLVIGEDLGTVPDAVREALARAGALSYRLLYFERDAAGAFRAPADYPRDALVSVGTHDLPTLAGWWIGRDLQSRRQAGLFPDEGAYRAQLAGREHDRVRLLEALASDGRLAPGADPAGIARGPLTSDLVDAVHAFLAATPARLMMVQPEDWFALVEQSNVPGTPDAAPNWRRKLPFMLDALAAEPLAERIARVLAAGRTSPATAPGEGLAEAGLA